jgi:hypothetical protein
MAINLITAPTPTAPASLADYQAQNNLLEAGFLNGMDKIQFDSNLILEGAVFNIGGAIYRADSNTAITGTPSNYVKITPAGSTASAAYVSNLSGVSWDAAYNGYYDGSGNLYLFDEGKALYNGQIATVFGKYLQQQKNGDVYIGKDLYVKANVDIDGIANIDDANISGDLAVDGTANLDDTDIDGSLDVLNVSTLNGGIDPGGSGITVKWKRLSLGAWDMDTTAYVDVAHGIAVPSDILGVLGNIRNDAGNCMPIGTAGTVGLTTIDLSFLWISTNIRVQRRAGGIFDNSDYDSVAINRGYLYICYKV